MKDNFEKIMDLGKVGITIASHNNGVWEKDHTYERLTLVMHPNGNTYVSKKSVVGVDPADDVDKDKTCEYWFKMTEHGHNVYEMLVAAGKYTGTEAEWIADAVVTSESAVEAQRKVDAVHSDVAELKQAIKALPDGQAVTATVAEHTTQIADLGSKIGVPENVINIITENFIDGRTGKQESNANYICTDYVDLSNRKDDKISFNATLYNNYGFAVYDEYGKYIFGIYGYIAEQFGYQNTTEPQKIEIELPFIAKYIRISMRSTFYASTKFNIDCTLFNNIYTNALIGEFVTPLMFGAKGDGVTDDSLAFKDMMAYAFRNHKSVRLYGKKYALSGDNPMGLPYITSETDIKILDGLFSGRSSYSLNVDGGNAWVVWTPSKEDDCLAFVGYLRHSRWESMRISVNSTSNYGDVFSTHFGVANQSHYFHENIFRSLVLDGSMRRVFSFYCGEDKATHDDLCLFQMIEASGYKTFFYTDNLNAVAHTFDNCSTLLNVNESSDFEIDTSVWTGMIRINNHHFTMMDCTNATFFKLHARDYKLPKKIIVNDPRFEIKGDITNWKYFDVRNLILEIDNMSTNNFSPISKDDIYGIVRGCGQVSIRNSSNVYTPFAVIGSNAYTSKTALILRDNSYQAFGSTSLTGITLLPSINYYADDDMSTPLTRYEALYGNVGVSFPNIILSNSVKHEGQAQFSDFKYNVINSSNFVADNDYKKTLSSIVGVNNLVNKSQQYNLFLPIKANSLKYYCNNVNSEFDLSVYLTCDTYPNVLPDNCYIDGTTGREIPNDNGKATGFCYIGGRRKNIVYVTCTLYNNYGLAYYDRNKKYLGGIYGNNASQYGYNNQTDPQDVAVEVPDDAVYIRASIRSAKFVNKDSFNILKNPIATKRISIAGHTEMLNNPLYLQENSIISIKCYNPSSETDSTEGTFGVTSSNMEVVGEYANSKEVLYMVENKTIS